MRVILKREEALAEIPGSARCQESTAQSPGLHHRCVLVLGNHSIGCQIL